jgi:hypothetical protein
VPDTRACGTRRLSDGLSVQLPPPRGRVYRLDDYGNFSNALTPPEGVGDCELGGFRSFAWITNGVPHRQQLVLPRYPTAARLASRHGQIVVVASQQRRFIPTAVTTRRVRLVFTRVG